MDTTSYKDELAHLKRKALDIGLGAYLVHFDQNYSIGIFDIHMKFMLFLDPNFC